jgi:hypothetical protein
MDDENDEPKRNLMHYESNDTIAELTPAQLGYILIDNTASLPNHDPRVYRKLCATILDEIEARSIFDYIDADDFAYNRTMENLFRRAMTAAVEKNKKSYSNTSITTKEELRGELLSGPVLETLHKLSKLEDNYARNRRVIGKEMRASSGRRKRPSAVPIQCFPAAAEESPPLIPDQEQADEEVNQDGE